MVGLELLKGGTAESRATTILMSLFGYTVIMELLGLDVWDKMLSMMIEEITIVEKHGFTTMPAAPDCRKMNAEELAKAIPGIITWEHLQIKGED